MRQEMNVSLSFPIDSYSDAGKHAMALELKEKVLALRRAKLGEDHPSTFGSMSSLASRFANPFHSNKILISEKETIDSRILLRR